MNHEFQAWYLGCVPNVSITKPPANGSVTDMSTVRSADVQLIDRVENAQLEGRLPMNAAEKPQIRLHVSKHGVKLIDPTTSDVLDRYPLHTVAQAVSYNDGYNRFNVALKVGQTGKSQFTCHVFQTQSEKEAETLCNMLREIFDQVIRSQSPLSSTTSNSHTS